MPVRICLPPVQRASQRRRRGERSTHRPSPRRQRARDLLDSRLHEFGDAEQLPGLRADFFAHPSEAGRARLQIGDPDGVLERHPQREAPRRRLGERPCAVRRALRIEGGDSLHAIQVQRRVVAVLVVDGAAHALESQRLHGRGQPPHAIEQRLQRRRAGPRGHSGESRHVRSRRTLASRVSRRARRAAQASSNAARLVATAMPLFLMAASKAALRNGSTPLPPSAPEQHGADHAVVPLGHRVHVEQHQPLRLAAHQLEQLLLVRRALAHRALFADGVGAMGRGDQRGPLADRRARAGSRGRPRQAPTPARSPRRPTPA